MYFTRLRGQGAYIRYAKTQESYLLIGTYFSHYHNAWDNHKVSLLSHRLNFYCVYITLDASLAHASISSLLVHTEDDLMFTWITSKTLRCSRTFLHSSFKQSFSWSSSCATFPSHGCPRFSNSASTGFWLLTKKLSTKSPFPNQQLAVYHFHDSV